MSTVSTPSAQARAVRFDRYGGREVLSVREVPTPHPGPREVLVEVQAAGIYPGEALIRSGVLHELLPATFPSGEGTNLAGTVLDTGTDVTDFGVGDAVLGYPGPAPVTPPTPSSPRPSSSPSRKRCPGR